MGELIFRNDPHEESHGGSLYRALHKGECDYSRHDQEPEIGVLLEALGLLRFHVPQERVNREEAVEGPAHADDDGRVHEQVLRIHKGQLPSLLGGGSLRGRRLRRGGALGRSYKERGVVSKEGLK